MSEQSRAEELRSQGNRAPALCGEGAERPMSQFLFSEWRGQRVHSELTMPLLDDKVCCG